MVSALCRFVWIVYVRSSVPPPPHTKACELLIWLVNLSDYFWIANVTVRLISQQESEVFVEFREPYFKVLPVAVLSPPPPPKGAFGDGSDVSEIF